MADPNVRRLLDACKDERGSHFHYLTRPDYVVPQGVDMDHRVADLQRRAEQFGQQTRRDRPMSDDAVREAVETTLKVARELDRRLMRTLGLKVAWFRDFADLPAILKLITHGTAGVKAEA